MNKNFKDSGNAGIWTAIGIGIGGAVFAATNEPAWIGVGVAIGAAFLWVTKKKYW
tara:strand:- start:1714 stop:1878 length:165 start_codon:yes stop_codon:yes gene_type:complete